MNMVHEPLTKEQAEEYVAKQERAILIGDCYGRSTNVGWMGIEFMWQPLPLSKGGKLKRNGIYGNILYSYRDKNISRDDVISEVMKPASLRQALVEAESVIECSMCGKIAVGQEAIEAHSSYVYEFTDGSPIMVMRWPRPCWSSFFYHWINDECIHLELCPICKDNIYKGKYRKRST
jgi:hypothetical protein